MNAPNQTQGPRERVSPPPFDQGMPRLERASRQTPLPPDRPEKTPSETRLRDDWLTRRWQRAAAERCPPEVYLG